MSDPTSNLIKADGEEVSNATLKAFTEALTGIAASDKKEWALSFGYLLQRVRGGKLLKTFNDEWAKYRKKGKIKDDYLATEQGLTCFQELLDSIDKDSPDETKFLAMQAVLLAAGEEKLEDRDSVLPQQLMRICRQLASGEVLVLMASYDIWIKRDFPQPQGGPVLSGNKRDWTSKVVARTGLRFPELVQTHERTLVEKCLLSEHRYGDESGFELTEHYRLTRLGHSLCDFIARGKHLDD